MVIPTSADSARMRETRAAVGVELSPAELS
jgi:hypothetical protein